MQTGLRNATPEDIASLKDRYEKLGYEVTHLTEGLPYNGVLKCVPLKTKVMNEGEERQ